MKRAPLLMIPLFLLVVLTMVVSAEIPQEAGLPTGVQERLDQYIASADAPSQATVLMVERARRPWTFTRELSDRVLGDSVYFQTDASLTWAVGSGPSPLPFPPKELWCALLAGQDNASSEQSYAIVLVGLHMDMYNGDWMVHETAEDPFTLESQQMLTRIGCKMVLN